MCYYQIMIKLTFILFIVFSAFTLIFVSASLAAASVRKAPSMDRVHPGLAEVCNKTVNPGLAEVCNKAVNPGLAEVCNKTVNPGLAEVCDNTVDVLPSASRP